jgi:hypothetical protein
VSGAAAEGTPCKDDIAMASLPSGKNSQSRQGKRNEMRVLVLHPVGRQHDHVIPDFVPA